MGRYNWQEFLSQWNRELLASADAYTQTLPPEVIASGWLGYPGANDKQIAQAERRLGVSLPPSYREFLKTTNWWRMTSPSIDKLWSVEEVEWFAVRHQGWIDAWIEGARQYGGNLLPIADEEYFVYGEGQIEYLVRPEYLQTALEISDRGDSAIYLLNPQVCTVDGEWEAWFFANWLAGAARYRSFWELMEAEHRTFLSL
jgi:cell wall assembly regulator SMI1